MESKRLDDPLKRFSVSVILPGVGAVGELVEVGMFLDEDPALFQGAGARD